METWRGSDVPTLPGRGGEPQVWDTATEGPVRAAAARVATMYACGITPYDATHIGHAATFIAWDLLVRAWLDAGHEVVYIQNVTDVDDPLLERASRDGQDWRDLADREIARYRGDMEALRVLPPTQLVGAVEALPLIQRFTRRLADRGALYDVDGDLYFSRAADPAFGAMSGLDPVSMVELFSERGGDPDRPGKKDPLDPLVWLAARAGEPHWESGFGPGRPGWHVECAAIATEYLGAAFDVQAGGSDLVFPHHEMSASHARVALGDGQDGPPGAAGGGREAGGQRPAPGPGDEAPERPGGLFPFARCYAHAGMVRLHGGKMSKSRGNLVFVSDLLAGGADPMAVRLAILAHHYRHDWDWTAAGLAEATGRLARWRAAVNRGLASPPGDVGGGTATGPGWDAQASRVLAEVRARYADDLDTPGALAAVDDWAAAMMAAAPPPRGAAAAARLVRDTVDALLGVAL